MLVCPAQSPCLTEKPAFKVISGLTIATSSAALIQPHFRRVRHMTGVNKLGQTVMHVKPELEPNDCSVSPMVILSRTRNQTADPF